METEDGTFCYDKTGRAGTAGPTGQGLLMTAAAAAATAAGTAARRRQGHFGSHGEAQIAQVYADALHLLQQFLVDAEREAVLFEPGVLVSGFVQSQDEPGAGAAAGSKIHTDGLAFLVRKIGFQLFADIFRQSDHSFSLTMPRPGLPVSRRGRGAVQGSARCRCGNC